MNTLVLVPDAYGGRGGIALYNRNLLNALSNYPGMTVTAIPRVLTYELEELPKNLTFYTGAVGSKWKYFLACFRIALSKERSDLIICTHLNLLPFAYLIKLFFKCPVIPIIYGVEAWTPTRHWLSNRICRKLEYLISIREWTSSQFIGWTKLKNIRSFLLPNCIDVSKYGIADRRTDLLTKYGIKDKIVIMTWGRLDEQRKGFDEVLEILPELKKKIPNVVYLALGDGRDRERLINKSIELGLKENVIFTGYIPDSEKADYYRLADVFAMPGSDRLFDTYPFRFVFLEAIACGVPVVGSRSEYDSEANDPIVNKMIIQVNPNDKNEIIQGILKALSFPKKLIPELNDFKCQTFSKKLHMIVNEILLNQH